MNKITTVTTVGFNDLERKKYVDAQDVLITCASDVSITHQGVKEEILEGGAFSEQSKICDIAIAVAATRAVCEGIRFPQLNALRSRDVIVLKNEGKTVFISTIEEECSSETQYNGTFRVIDETTVELTQDDNPKLTYEIVNVNDLVTKANVPTDFAARFSAAFGFSMAGPTSLSVDRGVHLTPIDRNQVSQIVSGDVVIQLSETRNALNSVRKMNQAQTESPFESDAMINSSFGGNASSGEHRSGRSFDTTGMKETLLATLFATSLTGVAADAFIPEDQASSRNTVARPNENVSDRSFGRTERSFANATAQPNSGHETPHSTPKNAASVADMLNDEREMSRFFLSNMMR